ncbi:MAG: hypothetical protein JWO02_3211 [Solirubrobacterales bacterium]|nr:hypothetical protein [Solirubrobacterales bacterium]
MRRRRQIGQAAALLLPTAVVGGGAGLDGAIFNRPTAL